MKVDLSKCDREPIHVPGSIQPHGVLLAFDEARLVRFASANAPRLLRRDASSCLEQPLDGALGTKQLDDLLADLAPAREPGVRRAAPLTLGTTGEVVNAVCHGNADGLTLLELEPHRLETDHDLRLVHLRTLRAIETMRAARDASALFEASARAVRALTGFDRVMIYRFALDAHGEVISEDREPELEPYLGLRYPASDIPAQARALYARQLLRLIPDATYDPVPIVPTCHSETARPLDLGDAVLRSVSPIHLRYLANMGVAASMSISIVVGGRLWGLVACHHTTPRLVAYEIRNACELVGQVLALQIEAREEEHARRAVLQAKEMRGELLVRLAGRERLGETLLAGACSIGELVGARGTAVILRDGVFAEGEVPDEPALRSIVRGMRPTDEGGTFATDHLAGVDESLAELADVAAGALGVAISPRGDEHVVWLRPEAVRTVTWAGDPNKPVRAAPDGSERLQPRRSFEAWKEELRGRSDPWQPWQIRVAEDFRSSVLDVVLEQAAGALHTQTERLVRLNQELARSNAELERFAAVASHDLLAPLRAIDKAASWIEDDDGARLSDDSRDALAMMRRRVASMEALVRDLLGYARAGAALEAPSEVDLASVAREVLDMVGLPDGFESHVEGRVPLIEAHATPLRTVLLNLVANALKHHHGPPGRIEVRLAEDGPLARIEVADDGPGIPEEDHERVFALFETAGRAEGGEERRGEGGLGLAVVRRIVDGHGGHVELDSAPGRGATFRVLWPRRPRRRGATVPFSDPSGGAR